MKLSITCLMICIVVLFTGCSHNTKPEYENTVAAVVILPVSGTVNAETLISMTVDTPAAEIRYTTDGTEPSLSSPKYLAPFTLNQIGTTIVKAIGLKQDWNPSQLSQAVYYVPHAQPQMVYVPGGNFNDGLANVSVNSFYIDKTEVTQAEYYAVLGSLPVQTKLNQYPVYYVSWFQAVAYCNRRSLLDGLIPCYAYASYGTNPANWPADYGSDSNQSSLVICNWAASGYRLPTEKEWLYAFLGGSQTHYYAYSGSDNWNTVAWCNQNSGYTAHPVATKDPNELGLYDLSGNLWEWCWDLRFDEKQAYAKTESKGISRSVRGGSWYSDIGTCSRFCSASYLPSYELSASIGFRCGRSGL